ncbi:MAG: single-stranded-DNA-specific exonuclease RecJ [Oscillospiraceae bacterium]|nr:single-stranded-DNA-specific exonuclease RecJ [Oscillospiraceae bacterium]
MRYAQWRTLPVTQSGSLAASILAARGMTWSDILPHDPFALPDMEKAVERIKRAVGAGEKIAVYGDYDVDGVTATCILTDYLRSKGADCIHHIPDRREMGYGLHTSALEQLKARGAALAVTVDVGVTAFEAAAAARDMGLDLIITDHHTCRDTLPDAVAVVNPKRADSVYPFSELAGAGVAFKLVCALEGENEGMRYAGLAALGTVADLAPLVDENRYITRRGLETLGKHIGISRLLALSGRENKPVTADTVSFFIAPLLNAAGRMSSADTALELLQTDDTERARYLAAALNDFNERRKEIENVMMRQALEMCGDGGGTAIVLAHGDWHPGITGIMASKLLERYRKPVFLITYDGDKAKGTARCPKHMDLTEMLGGCGDTLLGFGGHAAAAGFTLETARIEEFAEAARNAAASAGQLPREEALLIDAIVSPSEINRSNAMEIAALGPFGAGNPEPVLRLDRALIRRVIPLKNGRHLRLEISAGGVSRSVVCFGFQADGFPYRVGDTVDLAFKLTLNDFRGETSAQMELADIR